jgi:hypothetical protein
MEQNRRKEDNEERTAQLRLCVDFYGSCDSCPYKICDDRGKTRLELLELARYNYRKQKNV